MKSLVILFALLASVLASNPLDKRIIDPKTMDPTRLSVLSVLRTAMPTGPNVPLPTGDFTPEWYRNLPEDVKSLLPSLYPGTQAAPVTSAAPAAVSLASSSLLLLSTTVLATTIDAVGDLSFATAFTFPTATTQPTPAFTLDVNSTDATATASSNDFNGTLPSDLPPAAATFSGDGATLKTGILASILSLGAGAWFLLLA